MRESTTSSTKGKWTALFCHRHGILHEGRNVAHLLYFASVFYEGHGIYASMGGLLFLMGAAALILHEGEV